MNKYKCLSQNEFVYAEYKLVPIRFEDRLDIMKWRNEQIYHLRQSKPLTIDDQNFYFENVISKLFVQDRPDQLLFSLLKNNICIGYGGLVHINWTDEYAEISFIMDTSYEKLNFSDIWFTYLKLIQIVAFEELKLHKIYTYAFDLRPHLYQIFESEGFYKDAILRDHKKIDNKFIDVVIHSKINKNGH